MAALSHRANAKFGKAAYDIPGRLSIPQLTGHHRSGVADDDNGGSGAMSSHLGGNGGGMHLCTAASGGIHSGRKVAHFGA